MDLILPTPSRTARLCLDYRKTMRVQLSAILNMLFNEQGYGDLHRPCWSRQKRLPLLVPLPALLLAQRWLMLAYRGASCGSCLEAEWHRLGGAGDQAAEAGWTLEAGWWEGCISALIVGISFLFFPGNLTFILQALLEGLFHIFSLLIKPQPWHFSLVQLLSVMMC